MNTKKELRLFFALSFAWMWGLNLPRVLAHFEIISISPVLSTILGNLAVFGPGLAAFLLTRLESGKTGVRELWRRGWTANFNKKWFLPALLLMPLMGVLTWLILQLLDVPILWEYSLSPAMLVPVGLLIWLVGALPEEYGWRGYALGRMLENNSPLAASLVLGLIWGVWHLPLHFISTTTQSVIPIWEYIALTVVLSIIYTWLYLGTGGSVLIAGLFHAFGNITGAILPYWTGEAGRWVSFGLLLIPALLIMVFRFPGQEAEKKDLQDLGG